jgi:citrate lyase subunit beta / citryl-CoA lyase
MSSVRDARSLLFVPGTRPDRFDRAVASGADAVILDLEDSIAPAEKEFARGAVQRWLETGQSAVIRINAYGTPWHDDDLCVAARAQCPVLLPKADRIDTLTAVRSRLPQDSLLLTLAETARGIGDIAALCDSGLIDRVAFGSVDLAVELGLDPTAASATMDHARSAVILACAAAGMPAPWDGVTTAVDNSERLRADIEHALSLGFGGKLAIHPRQISAINQAWTPAPALIDWAERIIAAVSADGRSEPRAQPDGHTTSTLGVTSVDGQMVDLPLITRARQILARASLTAPSTTANGST